MKERHHAGERLNFFPYPHEFRFPNRDPFEPVMRT